VDRFVGVGAGVAVSIGNGDQAIRLAGNFAGSLAAFPFGLPENGGFVLSLILIP
jgi:hypothetical protein